MCIRCNYTCILYVYQSIETIGETIEINIYIPQRRINFSYKITYRYYINNAGLKKASENMTRSCVCVCMGLPIYIYTTVTICSFLFLFIYFLFIIQKNRGQSNMRAENRAAKVLFLIEYSDNDQIQLPYSQERNLARDRYNIARTQTRVTNTARDDVERTRAYIYVYTSFNPRQSNGYMREKRINKFPLPAVYIHISLCTASLQPYMHACMSDVCTRY